MPKGKFPYRRTIEFLSAGKLILKKSLRTITFSYTTQDTGKGLKNFILRDVPQLQYKNPLVQMMTFRNATDFPQIKLYFDDGHKSMIDVDGKKADDILELVGMIGGATDSELQKRKEEKYPGRTNPANFGRNGNFFCICEKPGQVPCSSKINLKGGVKEWHLREKQS
eukprot:gene6055-6756_t